MSAWSTTAQAIALVGIPLLAALAGNLIVRVAYPHVVDPISRSDLGSCVSFFFFVAAIGYEISMVAAWYPGTSLICC